MTTTYKPAQLQAAIVAAITSWEKTNNASIEDAWGLDRRNIARTLYQIAQAESGGSNAVGDTHIKNPDNNASYSPWQINKQHTSQVKAGKQYDHTKLTNDPRYAALAAIEIANDATTSSGDAFARFFPWTKHRLTNPNDNGPFQFARGSDAPNDDERATAIAAFDSGGTNWDSLDFSGNTYQAYQPQAGLPTQSVAQSSGTVQGRSNPMATGDDEGLGPIGDTGSVPSWKAPPVGNVLQLTNFKERLRKAFIAKIGADLLKAEGTGMKPTDLDKSITIESINKFLRGDLLSEEQLNSVIKASIGGTSEESVKLQEALVQSIVSRVNDFNRSGDGYIPALEDNNAASSILTQAAFRHSTDPNDRSIAANDLLGINDLTSSDTTQERGTDTGGLNLQAGFTEPNTSAAQAQQQQAQQQQAGQQQTGFRSQPSEGLINYTNGIAQQFGGRTSVVGHPDDGRGQGWAIEVFDYQNNSLGIYQEDAGSGQFLDISRTFGEGGKGGQGQFGSGQASTTSSGYSVRQDPNTGNPQYWDNQSGSWKDGTPPAHSTFTNMSGETLIVDQFGNQVGSFGVGFDEAANVRDFGENQRQFNKRLGLDTARFGEDIRQFDTRFGEDVRQFDLGFGENQRQFNTTENRMEKTLAANNYFQGLEELGRNYRTLVQTSPELANAATNQGKLITDILRGGGDVLARTYFTRGGMSPLPEITQADLINNLTDEMAKVQQFEVDATMAENQRRVAADMQRAQDEYGAFRTKREADARSAYQQFVSNMAPIGTQMSNTYDVVDTAGQDAANARKAAADAKLATFTGIQNVGGMDNYDAGTDTFTDPAVQSYYQSAQDMADEAAGAADASNFTTTETDTWMDYSQPTAPAFQDWRGTSRFAGQPTFADWQTNVGQSFANTPMLNVPNTPIPRAVTQEELIAQSRAVSPPAVQSLLSGQMPSPLQFGGLPLPTFQQLQALTPSEQEMLNTRLLTEFNVPLSDVAFQTQRQFSAPSMDRNRDLARFRGYSV